MSVSSTISRWSEGNALRAPSLSASINRFGLTITKLAVLTNFHVEADNFETSVVGLLIDGVSYADSDVFFAAQIGDGTKVKHTFSVGGDTSSGVVNSDDLVVEYADSSIGVSLLHIDVYGDTLDIWTSGLLTPAEEATLLTIVNNHLGLDPDSHDTHITITIIIGEITITDDVTWQDLGAMILIPSEFGQTANMQINAKLQAKCDDGPSSEVAQLRLVDDDTSIVIQLNTTPFDFTDSATWLDVAFESNIPPDADTLPHRLRLEGRLNGSTSASIRRSSLTLIEMR